MPQRFSREDFVQKLAKTHPNLILIGEYHGYHNPITVKCKIHDYTYETTPHRLGYGTNCQKCYDERRGNSTRMALEDFIAKAKEIHGDKYIYDKVDYKNSQTKVCIICPEHGEFWQTPDKHISRKHGCPKCAGRNKTTESVIEEFKKVHGDDYIYDKVDYKNNTTKVCIICKKHGEFWQTPDKHLQGRGCPICKESKLEIAVRRFLSDNNINFISQKRFDWLGMQSLDFYLPDYNISIECQGEQHFSKSYGIYLEKSTLEERICRDITKKKLCDDNGVKMIYVMGNRWKSKCFVSKFNGIYTEDNIILDTELERLLEITKTTHE